MDNPSVDSLRFQARLMEFSGKGRSAAESQDLVGARRKYCPLLTTTGLIGHSPLLEAGFGI